MTTCDEIRERFFTGGPLDRADPELEQHLGSCAACRLAAQGLPLVERALAELPSQPVSVPPFEAIARASARAARTQRLRVSLRRYLPQLVTGLAAASAAVVAFFAGPFFAPSGQAAPLLALGERIDSSAGVRQARLESGAKVRLDAGEVALVPSSKQEERLFLQSGSVSLEVPKLKDGRTVTVCTPDAEVRVHGTRFQVIRDSKGTSVRVAEGLVEVRPYGGGRAPVLVRPGESTTVANSAAFRKSLREAAQVSLDQGDFAGAQQRLASLLAADDLPAVERAETYALLAWSLAGSGNRPHAIVRYREALSLLPEDERPLWADNASAELALLLEQEDPTAAVPAWREYLRRFPAGVHASQARSRLDSEKER